MGLVVEADAGLPAVPVRCEWPDSTLIAIVDPLWLGTGTSISLLTNHSSADCSHRTPTINIFESYRDSLLPQPATATARHERRGE